MNNYYPFGLMWDNPDAMPNATYQGKEFQTNTFSDGSELALYDFGARMYDPVLGRWHCSDPMYQFDSPYNAMANNPVVNIDPDGMWSIPWGNIMSSIGGFLSSMTQTTSWVSLPFMTRNTITTQPNLGLGNVVSGAAMLLQAGLDGKKIQDAAREMGSKMILSGSISAQNTFVSMLNEHTGGRYYLKNNRVFITESYSPTGKISNSLVEVIDAGINAKEEVKYSLVANDASTLFDNYKTGQVDIADLQMIDRSETRAAFLGHFISERTNIENYKKRKARTMDAFVKSHNAAMIEEAAIIEELFGIEGSGTRTQSPILKTNRKSGYQVFYYGENIKVEIHTGLVKLGKKSYDLNGALRKVITITN